MKVICIRKQNIDDCSLAQVTCIAGQTCRLDGLQGVGLQQTDLLQVLDTCGIPALRTLAAASNASLTTATMGVDVTMTFPGGFYRLCWCATGFDCTLQQDFRVDSGGFYHVGPSPLHSQDRTCISGHTCSFEGISGSMLSANDSFWILDTCGILEAPSRLAGYGRAVPLNNSNLISWGDLPHTAAGGQFRLCWCAGVAQCEVSEQFRVDVGGLVLIGPSLQARTCVSGQPCFMKALPGFHLQAADRLLVLETCGVASPIQSFPSLVGLRNLGLNFTTELQGFVAGSLVEFVTSAGGQYSLCWCASILGCSVPESFRVSAGSLTLIGPSQDSLIAMPQLRICVAGRICALDNLLGQGLRPDDSVMLLDTCGTSSPSVAAVAMPLGVAGNISAWTSSNISVWTAAGGRYRLCWCAADHRCLAAADFRVDVGRLEIVGPSALQSTFRWQPGHCNENSTNPIAFSYGSMESCWAACANHDSNTSGLECVAAEFQVQLGLCQLWNQCITVLSDTEDTFVLTADSWKASQDRTCISGRPCLVPDISGHLLTEGDAYAILDTCASPSMSGLGGSNGRSQHVLGQGGYVNPCGCVSAMNDTDGDGIIDCADECPYDPSKAEVGICGCGQADIDSDSDGTRDCQDRCPADPGKQSPGICGCGIADTDTDFDGIPDCVDRCPHLIDNDGGTAGCIAADVDTDADGVLDFLDACPLDKNKTQAGVCGCGESDDDDDNDGVPNCVDSCPQNPHKVFPGACGCWQSDLDRDGDGTPDCYDVCQSYDSVFSSVSIDFGMVLAGEYRLCWCSRSVQACVGAAEFHVDLGSLTVIGPLEHHRTCISGQPCQLEGFAGVGLANDDRLLVLDTCATSSLVTGWVSQSSLELQSSGSSTSWSPVIATAAGGQYRLCWCTTREFACDGVEDFGVDMGSLTLIGPYLEQSYTCVAGQACGLDGLGGLHLSVDDTIMVLDTCGSAQILTSLLASAGQGFFHNAGSSPNASLALLAVPGGQYRLCWCSAYQPCPSTGHALDFGGLEVVGPWPLAQDRTCVSGQTCEFALQVFRGSADSLLLLDTCGLDTTIPFVSWMRGHCGKASIIGMVPLQDYMVLVDLQAASASDCQELCESHMTVTNTSCVAAMYKDVELNVSDYAFGERQVGHCRLYSKCSPVSDESSEYVVLTMRPQGVRHENWILPTQINVGNVTSISVGDGTTVAVYSWGDIFITSAGTTYRMCWCASGFQCDLPSDFPLDLGSFTLIGPVPFDSSRTCVSGMSCIVMDISGIGLSQYDQILLQDTCGADFNGPFSMLASSNTSNATMGVDGTLVIFNDEEPLVVQGGRYRLCWCAAGFSCVLQPHSTDIGELVFLGPSPLQQQRTCMTGQWCSIEGLAGLGLDASDDFVIMDTCTKGDALRIFRFPAQGYLIPEGTPAGSWSSATAVSAAGGSYRLCWCPRGGCSSPSSAGIIDVGALHLLGPTLLDVHQTCVSGQRCALRYSGNMVVADASGIRVGDFLRVLDTCGMASFTPGFPDAVATEVLASGAVFSWGAEIVFAAAGSFRLCWCAAGFDCSASDAFRVDLGDLTVLGPPAIDMQRTCVSGLTCAFAVPQISAASQILALQTCGTHLSLQGFPATPAFLGLPAEANVSNVSFAEAIYWSEHVTGPGGQFRLCWCGAYDGCHSLEDFRVDMGVLTLLGPAPLAQHRTCVSGYSCVVDGLQGDLSFMDNLMVLDTCGADDRNGLSFEPGSNTSVPGEDGHRRWVVASTSQAGGQYRMCWCSAVGQCSTADEYRVDVGSLSLVGPSPLIQQWTCIGGVACDISFVYGNDLSANDSVAILDSCGSGTFSNGWLAEALAATFVGPQTIAVEFSVPVTAAAGTYRLCWCQPLRETVDNCNLFSQHRVDFGQVTLLGPSRSQHHTCIAGQPCVLEGLLGPTALDSLVVLDSCSTSSPVSGWPQGGLFSSVGASGAIFSFGADIVTAAGGLYQLCWCAASNDCRPGGEEFLSIGHVILVGPQPLEQYRTCTSGQLCNFGTIEGSFIEPLKLEEVADFRFLQDGTASQFNVKDYYVEMSYDMDLSNPLAATWITLATCTALEETDWQNCSWTPISAPFWRWRITQTWGAGPPRPREVQFNGAYRSATDWVVEDLATGTATEDLSDPSNPIIYLAQNLMDGWGDSSWWPTGSFTEWSVVFDLRQGDSLALLATCGAGEVHSTEVGTAYPTYGRRLLTLAGGLYRLCWCSRGFDCNSAQAFSLDVGAVMIQGPAPLSQSRTCVSGEPCTVDDIRVEGITGSLHVLDTCGQGFAHLSAYGWSGSFTQVNISGDLIPKLALDSGFLMAAGGTFRLCWCADTATCDHPDDVRVDVGELLVLGISPLQQARTCVSGQTCSFDGISGYHLQASDQFLILGTCGIMSSAVPVTLSVALSESTLSASTEPAVLAWPGGQYRLCWCSGQFDCIDGFRTDVGALNIVGPRDMHAGTCVSGQLCSLEGIQGKHLSAGDSVLVLDTCGVATTLPRFPNSGRMDVVQMCECAAGNSDSDLDGVRDCLDECPLDPNRTKVGLCGCGVDDIDSDSDGVPDCLDECPQDPAKSKLAGICGCNVAETDSDLDGVPDCLDLCPTDPNKYRPGICPGPEWLVMGSKVTHQSSTASDRNSQLAVDETVSANFYHGSCTLTTMESHPYWYVDLAHVFDVELVRLTPRTDCCDTSLLGLEVWMSDISTLP